MTEIPEAAGRPCVVEYGGTRREVGTISRAYQNEDGSITVELEIEDGFTRRLAAPAPMFSLGTIEDKRG